MQRDDECSIGIERSDAGKQASRSWSVKALGWLVEQKRLRAPEQTLRDAQPTPLAA